MKQHISTLVSALVSFLAVSLAVAAIPVVTAGSKLHPDEVWIASGDNGPCGIDHICAEWFVEGTRWATCCIPPSYLGTSNPEACEVLINGLHPRDSMPSMGW